MGHEVRRERSHQIESRHAAAGHDVTANVPGKRTQVEASYGSEPGAAPSAQTTAGCTAYLVGTMLPSIERQTQVLEGAILTRDPRQALLAASRLRQAIAEAAIQLEHCDASARDRAIAVVTRAEAALARAPGISRQASRAARAGIHAQLDRELASWKHALEVDDADGVLDIASDVLAHERGDEINGVPPAQLTALRNLLAAKTGQRGGETITGEARLSCFEQAMTILDPAIALYGQDEEHRAWIEEHLTGQLADLRSSLEFTAANDRVTRSVTLDDRHVIDPVDDSKPHEQAALLHASLPKLIATLHIVADKLADLHHESLELHAKEIIRDGRYPSSWRIQTIDDLTRTLTFVNGLLILRDDEAVLAYRNASSMLSRVASLAELVKAVVELASGTLGVTAALVSLVLRAAGAPKEASALAGIAGVMGGWIGKVVAGIEFVHGVAILAAPDTREDQKIDAAVEVTTATLTLLSTIPEVTSVANPASIAIEGGYELWKRSLALCWGSSLGMTAVLMQPAFETLQGDAYAIAHARQDVIKAQLLVHGEPDGRRRQALERVLVVKARLLGTAVDGLIDDMHAPALEADMAQKPGGSRILHEALDPLRACRGRTLPNDTLRVAGAALDRLRWVLQHAAEIEIAAAKYGDLADVQREIDRREQRHTKEAHP